MANIIFCTPPMTGPINSGLNVARELKARGHQVTYIGIADCESTLRANGFNFIAVYQQWFPKGWLTDYYRQFQEPGSYDFNRLLMAFLDHLLGGGDEELLTVFQNLNPDLVIISASEFDSVFWGLLAQKLKLKCVYLFDVLGGIATHSVPPVHTDMIADGSFRASVKISRVWLLHKIRMKFGEYYLAWKGIEYLSSNKIKKLADYCEYPRHLVDFYTDMPSPQLKIPQIALFPQCFDFPGANRVGRHYVEASIDFERKQVDFPWEKINDSKPLVYVALSTLPLLQKKDYARFFNTVLDVAGNNPEWQWVISIGNVLSLEDFHSVPANSILVNQAPQLDLIKKAFFVITHGGPSSIKECIYFSVPMIVFPLWFDQHGNAARVVYHRLGLKGDFGSVTADSLQSLISELIENPIYRNNLAAMQSKFREREIAKPSMTVIENLITAA